MQNDNSTKISLDILTGLCKRRGFIFQSSEIYGGLNGFWDYGPLGTELKNNLRDAWWQDMVRSPPVGPDGEVVNILGLDSSIIQNPRVWEASGHVGGFNDPMSDCRESKSRYRADHLVVYLPQSGDGHGFACLTGNEADAEKRIRKQAKADPSAYKVIPFPELPAADLARIWGPDATGPGTLTEPRQFNLMFKTFIGAASGEDNLAYLRPETAQGIFTNYKHVVDTMRVKLPFGIAQIGKSFRNEVTPRNFIFRSREFEQMELEWFCHPDEAQKWYDFWVAERLKWWESLGIRADYLQRRDHDPDELAHYSTACADVEYRYGFTDPEYGELEGVAHRGDYDLTQHQTFSGTKLEYFDQETNTRVLPHVIEPSSGLTRGVLVLLNEAYREEFVPKGETEGGPIEAIPGSQPPEGYEKRVVMRFAPRLAPVKVAVFPLLKNRPELVEKAKAIHADLRRDWAVDYDQTGAIGRRYRRQDEIGTPFCVTIDFDSLEDDTVTVRERDSMHQERVAIADLRAWLHNKGL
ncbi:MAG: glycine--tRNA ligase [Verrucomicrobia bacterium]|nr:glycine--tRNA ligase [Verrucomicrobiota bacterium]MCH8511704.1 glycine--tRNA ligase [Kiritimatiellia bacterium]